MKRARIKAMVTVPTRRKATPVAPVNEITNLIEHNEKGKNIFNDISMTSQQISENNYQEKQMQESLDGVKQLQNEQLDVDYLNNEYTDESIQNFEESRKEIVQPSEIVCTTQTSSPIKLMQNRLGFMKPIPKFDSGEKVRKNSIQGSGASASESEDDSKRVICTNTNNTRNDLIPLIQTAKDTVTNNIKNNLTTSKVGQKRRILISESARKLAEARKEFQLKHENKTPDRSKLTMYDLIYYNPVTNPMKKSKESTVTTRKTIEYLPEEFQEEEENEDDPSSAMPVPQVKVGPNGQLIIDEQSLVIEQTNAKKSREVLSKEAIIDDDNSGNGFYKKRQKSKEWSKLETLKFYKALNTVGTDFLLMQSLFPNRTRQEIKIKFKKEEKVNRNLVEKALAYHQEFDTEILEKSLATFESSEEKGFVTQEKRRQQKGKDKKNIKSKRRRKSRIVASSIAEMDISDKEDEEEYGLNLMVHKENTKINCEYQETLNNVDKKMSKEKNKLSEKSLIEVDDVDSLSSYNGPDSDTEVYNVKPTRSGRFPKVKKLQGPDINTLDNEELDCLHGDKITMSPEENAKVAENLFFDNTNVDSESHHTNSIKTVIPNIADVEPGSLVILSKESPEEPGKSVLQVYMVSSDVNSQDIEKSNITPVNISPELLATVTAKLSNVESVPVKKQCE
ncbi:Transcription factor TFIIIB component B'' like protein [Habropoda laboriosa]|uniref:Transcription factor TFIIIB component B'' like protein n=2 Tax=Habropoda laboriosa TaxID=597456 RepID=A0A0L7R3F0_9HYME|nr:Transcription factor TFIIIB component B'' like protein [Habropoda laboriosa]